jgi:hypothetical protein
MSRKLYRNQADRFFNMGGDVPLAQPTSGSTSNPATQPVDTTTYTRSVDTGTLVNKPTSYSIPEPEKTATKVSGDVLASSVIPTPDPINTTNVVVVQPNPLIVGGASSMYRGGGGSMGTETKVKTPTAKNSLIKTYLLPLLIIGAGVYVFLKKPIKN